MASIETGLQIARKAMMPGAGRHAVLRSLREPFWGGAILTAYRSERLSTYLAMSAFKRILLQKSKVASVRIFGETLKHEAIDDSDNLSRATEVAYEFSVRG